jgi:hypothetical protein
MPVDDDDVDVEAVRAMEYSCVDEPSKCNSTDGLWSAVVLMTLRMKLQNSTTPLNTIASISMNVVETGNVDRA